MNERFYVVEVTTGSTGTETRNITGYDNYEVALRKFFAPLGSVGAGPLKICVLLLDSGFNTLKREVWAKPDEPEDEPSEE